MATIEMVVKIEVPEKVLAMKTHPIHKPVVIYINPTTLLGVKAKVFNTMRLPQSGTYNETITSIFDQLEAYL